MNFRLEDMVHKLRTDVILVDRDTHEQFIDKLRFIFIELPSFTKEEAECETDFERCIYVLKNMETLKRLPFKARKAVFEKLEKIVDIASLSKKEREKYDESIKVYHDHLATLTYAEQKGKREGAITIARKMKKESIPVEQIARLTELSVKEIEKL
ncbi:MAG: PD-(D/E)XK nuclease family transposase [Prolixibacteraceae bacterium]